MEQSQQVIPRGEDSAVVAVERVDPLRILANAVEKGVAVDRLQELRSLVEWHEDREAKKAFNLAFAKFRAEAIEIVKNRRVAYTNRQNQLVEYKHATLDAVCAAVVPRLSTYDLAHYWTTKQTEDGKRIYVTTTIMHAAGHSIETTLFGEPDTSGSKNPIQAIGSTVHYLERYGFLALTGLAAKGMDDDGAGAGDDDDDDEREPITEDQVKELKRLLDESESDIGIFLQWAMVDSLEELPRGKYQKCVDRLYDKLEKAKKDSTS